MIEWLNRWIRPTVGGCPDIEVKGSGYKKREDNKCWCGAGLITFFSRGYRQCISVKCGKKYGLYDGGVEIKHQREG
jgi:hypothetical protein